MENKFDPTENGFVELLDFKPPWRVSYFEFRNHASVDGTANFQRLNCYLSKDSNFVTIWQGCLEPVVFDSFLGDADISSADYDEPLFRGYIDDQTQAAHILRALRLESPIPQIVRKTEIGKIVCERLPEA